MKKCIAIICPKPSKSRNQAIRGIWNYLETNKDWLSPTNIIQNDIEYIETHRNHFDGILLSSDKEADRERIQALQIPCVEFCSSLKAKYFASVKSNSRKLGIIAARYFNNINFKNYVFCKSNSLFETEAIQYSFQNELNKLQANFSEIDLQKYKNTPPTTQLNNIEIILKKLNKPCAILCDSEETAFYLIQSCKQLNLLIPDQISILSTDSSKLCSTILNCPLSSIEKNATTIGWKAAETLNEILINKNTTLSQRLIAPIKVNPQLSSDTYINYDKIVAEAMHTIRENAFKDFYIQDLLETLPISRRTFEKRFLKTVGHPPHRELVKLRIKKAQELLRESKLNLKEVAAEIGFDEQRKLTRLFKTELDLTPTQYREMRLKTEK